MKLGVALPQVGEWATPESVIRIARYAEELGYNSVWVQERLLWPLNPRKPYPASPDGSLPDIYKYVMDPIISLAYVASQMKKIRIGTAIINLPYHTPSVLAKQLATLDIISGGRLDVGIGLGWSEDEYIATNVEFKDRGERVDEFLKCIKKLWTEDEPEFNGKHYKLPKSVVNPKPVQKPHPPITVGGFTPQTFERAVTLGDGYNALIMQFDQMDQTISALKDAAEVASRDFNKLQVVCRAFPAISQQSGGDDRNPLNGTVAEIKDDIKHFENLGVTEIFFDFNFEQGITADKMVDYMERLTS